MGNYKKLEIVLDFEGPFYSVDEIPESKGIYVAYAKIKGGYHLLYIGRATGNNTLKKRIEEHFRDDHNTDEWKENYDIKSQKIFYIVAALEDRDDDDICDAEKALIHRLNPPVNQLGKDKYNGDSYAVFIKCNGKKMSLDSQITVDKLN